MTPFLQHMKVKLLKQETFYHRCQCERVPGIAGQKYNARLSATAVQSYNATG